MFFAALFPSKECLTFFLKCFDLFNVFVKFFWNWVIAEIKSIPIRFEIQGFMAYWNMIFMLFAMTTHDWIHVIRKKITRKLNIKVISNLHGDSIQAINISRVFFCNLPTFAAPFGFWIWEEKSVCHLRETMLKLVETNNSKWRGFHHHAQFARIREISCLQCF